MAPAGDAGRWMLFVDGENVTIRGQQLAEARSVVLAEGPYYQRDGFLWLNLKYHATIGIRRWLGQVGVQEAAVRAFYCTSQVGDTDALNRTKEALWTIGFSAQVFKKLRRQSKAKGVDIALTKDLLSNAFLDNYDIAVVLTGDADYEPVISEVKRLGKRVCLMGFTEAGANISLDLKLSADYFIPVDPFFLANWPSQP